MDTPVHIKALPPSNFPLATCWAQQMDPDNKTTQFLQISSRDAGREFWGSGYLACSLEDRGPKVLMIIFPWPHRHFTSWRGASEVWGPVQGPLFSSMAYGIVICKKPDFKILLLWRLERSPAFVVWGRVFVGLNLSGLWTVKNRASPASTAGPAHRLLGAPHSIFSIALSGHLSSFLRSFYENQTFNAFLHQKIQKNLEKQRRKTLPVITAHKGSHCEHLVYFPCSFHSFHIVEMIQHIQFFLASFHLSVSPM